MRNMKTMKIFKAAPLPWKKNKKANTKLVCYNFDGERVTFAVADSGFSEWEILGWTYDYTYAKKQAQEHFECILRQSGLVKELK